MKAPPDWTDEHDAALAVLEHAETLLRPPEEVPALMEEMALAERKLHRGRDERWNLVAVLAFARLRRDGLWGEDLLGKTSEAVGAKPSPKSAHRQLKALRLRARRDLDEILERTPPRGGDRFTVVSDPDVLGAVAVVLDRIPKPPGA